MVSVALESRLGSGVGKLVADRVDFGSVGSRGSLRMSDGARSSESESLVIQSTLSATHQTTLFCTLNNHLS